MSQTLTQTVRALLQERPASLTLNDIATATGVSEAWLQSMTRSKTTKDAGADRCQRIYEHLTGRKLLPTAEQ